MSDNTKKVWILEKSSYEYSSKEKHLIKDGCTRNTPGDVFNEEVKRFSNKADAMQEVLKKEYLPTCNSFSYNGTYYDVTEYYIVEYNVLPQDNKQEEKPVGRINYLHVDGRVRESFEYTDEEKFKKDIQKENYYGVPMTVDVYTDKNGKKIDTAFLYECDPPLHGVLIMPMPEVQEDIFDLDELGADSPYNFTFDKELDDIVVTLDEHYEKQLDNPLVRNFYKTQPIRVIVAEPGELPEVRLIDPGLNSLQDIVGGYIESVYGTGDYVIYGNESGKLMGLTPNFITENDIFVGTLVAVGIGYQGNTVSLDDYDVRDVKNYFDSLEIADPDLTIEPSIGFMGFN